LALGTRGRWTEGQAVLCGMPYAAFAGSIDHGRVRSVGNGPTPDLNARVSVVSRRVPGVDSSRKGASGRIARKPAPVLVLRTLTFKMTVNFRGATSGALQIKSLEGSLMIEWE
jgi:hypothetical protein